MSNQQLKPLNKRYSPGYAVRRAKKREDRATFRQQAQQGFGELSNGLRVIDYAVVGVYEQFVNFRTAQIALDIAYVIALLLAVNFLALYIVLTAGAAAYVVLAMHMYRIRKRAADAKEKAYLAALNAAQASAPPPTYTEPPTTLADDLRNHTEDVVVKQ